MQQAVAVVKATAVEGLYHAGFFLARVSAAIEFVAVGSDNNNSMNWCRLVKWLFHVSSASTVIPALQNRTDFD